MSVAVECRPKFLRFEPDPIKRYLFLKWVQHVFVIARAGGLGCYRFYLLT